MFLSKELDEKLIMAFEIYNKKLFESFPTDEELENITFSENFENKMQKLINMQKKSYFYLINTVGKRVAIILAAIIIGLTATTFGVKAIRETVIEFITETFERFTKVSVESEELDEQPELVKAAPTYVPEGYIIESEVDIDGLYKIEYSSQGKIGFIRYNQKFGDGTINNLDTEDIEYEKININFFEGIKYNKNGVNKVVFVDETYMYTVYGEISFEELIKMSESIKTE